MKKKIIIICGPTASGKSAYAMDLARQKNGAIINADSMQIYQEIPILTASPRDEDKKAIPHHLYNYLSIKDHFSVVQYQKEALAQIAEVENGGYCPIIVGGTGLYISSLLYGINLMPDIDPNIRSNTRALLAEIGNEAFHEKLTSLDPSVAARLSPGDSQRMLRAYEVYMQTGKSILHFQEAEVKSPLADYDIETIMISPKRSALYRNCDERFAHIVRNGALEEVKNSMGKGNSKALGFEQLSAYLKNEISLEEAITLAQNKTRQYAKRQVTWFNHQIKDKVVINNI